MRLTGAMRATVSTTVALVLAGLLTGCSLFGGDRPKVPEGDSWREDVVEALEGTPGVTSADVTVNEVDDGGGGKGPVLYGKFTVTGDAQSVVDDAMHRVSEVLGPDSRGVGVNLSVTSPEGVGQNLRDFGYGSARHGAALWEATH